MSLQEKIEEIMLEINKKKGVEQIAEVERKGLWDADCISVELSEYAQAIAKYIKSKVPKKKEIENIIHTACMEYHANYDEYSQVPTQLWKFLDRYSQAIADFHKESAKNAH